MTREKVLIFIAMLGAAAPCTAQTAAPPASGTLTASCPMPNGVWFNPGELQSVDQFIAARGRVQDFLEASRAARACLRASFMALEADWKAAGQAPDSVVAKAVEDVLRARELYDEAVMSGYNRTAERYNARPAAGGAAPVPTIDFSLAQSDDGQEVMPPPPGRLTLPTFAIGATHDCSRFYTLESKVANEAGRVTIGYDVGADGAIQNARIVTSSGVKNLDDAAMACVTTQWRNTPAIDKGAIVASPGHQATIAFELW